MLTIQLCYDGRVRRFAAVLPQSLSKNSVADLLCTQRCSGIAEDLDRGFLDAYVRVFPSVCSAASSFRIWSYTSLRRC